MLSKELTDNIESFASTYFFQTILLVTFRTKDCELFYLIGYKSRFIDEASRAMSDEYDYELEAGSPLIVVFV